MGYTVSFGYPLLQFVPILKGMKKSSTGLGGLCIEIFTPNSPKKFIFGYECQGDVAQTAILIMVVFTHCDTAHDGKRSVSSFMYLKPMKSIVYVKLSRITSVDCRESGPFRCRRQ